MRLFYRKPFSLCCFFLICGAVIGYFADIVISLCAMALLLLVGVVFGITAFLRRKRDSFFTVVLPVLSAVFGIAYFMIYTVMIGNLVEKYTAEESHSIETTVVSRVFLSNYLSIYNVRTSDIDGEKQNIKMRLEVPFYLELEAGEKIRTDVALSDFGIVDGFNEKQYYNTKGYFFIAEGISDEVVSLGKSNSLELILEKLREGFSSVFEENMDEESAGLVTAVFLGDRDGLSDVAKRDFKRTGGYHLLALSGMHLSVFTAILNAFMALLGIKKGKRYAALTVVTIFYVALTGFCLSMVRSAIMLFAVYVGYYLRSRGDGITSLAFAAAVIIIASPQAMGDIGFWMSVLATFGIIIALPLETLVRFKLRKISNAVFHKGLSYISSTLILSFSAILMTLPFSCFCFYAISLVGPVVTLVLSSVVSLILIFAPLILLLFWFPAVSDILCFACELVSHFILWITNLFSEMENIYVSLEYDFVIYLIVPFFVIFTVMLASNLRHKLMITIFVSAWIVVFAFFEYNALSDPAYRTEYIRRGKNEYFCISVSGDNALIDISDGSFNNLSHVGTEAVRKGFCEIDAVVLTHLHNRHIISLRRLASEQMLRRVIIPEPINEAEASAARSIEYEMALLGVETEYYGEDESLMIYGAKFSAERAYIKRSTHPVLKLSFEGALELTYIGSSYLEYGDTDVSRNIIIGKHGPICKKNFYIDASRSELISFADEELFSFAEINMGENTKLIKNAVEITLSE